MFHPTGSSMTKYMERIEDMKRNYRYKKDELFKRIKVSTFAQLVSTLCSIWMLFVFFSSTPPPLLIKWHNLHTQVLQVASVAEDSDGAEMISEELQRLEDSASVISEADAELATYRTNGKEGSPSSVPLSPIQLLDHESGEPVQSARSTLQSVISGVGELDLGNTQTKNPNKEQSQSPRPLDKPYSDCPFLLLDVRDRDCYEQCHVIGAHSYPIAMLSRTMNPYTHDILEFKNSHGKIIILYDEDERMASQAATTMCERGFENIFMLSGGLKVIAQRFPEGLTTGTFPVACLPEPTQTKSGRKRTTPRELHTPAENKWRFSAEDLEKIEQYLDKTLTPTDTASRLSSRLSTGRLDSKLASSRNSQVPSSASSASARTLHSISPHNKPWK
uniref:Centrosomal protein 41 n=1 Tax=Leptobrachium leishanense TaxID=445787 RepID=A0A8C5QQS8_9ANUR